MNITLKDGSILQAEAGINAYQAAGLISEGLARNALIARVDGELVDLAYVLRQDCSLEILTFKDEEGREAYRHTAAHILAQAVKSIFPTAQLAIGPAIKNGFYYDFDFSSPVTLEDFEKIEKEMNDIIKADFRSSVSKSVASKRSHKCAALTKFIKYS